MQKIIHLDADCFFASVEIRDNPKLRGMPVAVGGAPDKRGVIATCNYEARRFGVHSAMVSSHAQRLCPGLIFIKPDIGRYRVVSNQMREIFAEYTSRIEPLSLDEAFLDVSDSECCQGSATLIAKEIQIRIARELGISVSAGVAQVKFLAKIASDWKKPSGITVIAPGKELVFLSSLNVKKLPGVGPVMRNKLAREGIQTCQDALKWDLKDLVLKFGSSGERLYQMCRGIDTRKVESSTLRKCVSVETTFDSDLPTIGDIKSKVPVLVERLKSRIPKKQSFSGQFVKMKFDDFTINTMESRIGLANTEFELDNFERLMLATWHRQKRPVRLMGVGLRYSESERYGQLRLPFEELVS